MLLEDDIAYSSADSLRTHGFDSVPQESHFEYITFTTLLWHIPTCVKPCKELISSTYHITWMFGFYTRIYLDLCIATKFYLMVNIIVSSKQAQNYISYMPNSVILDNE
jgi:hypothetical protein